jgi:hypothetical protein
MPEETGETVYDQNLHADACGKILNYFKKKSFRSRDRSRNPDLVRVAVLVSLVEQMDCQKPVWIR